MTWTTKVKHLTEEQATALKAVEHTSSGDTWIVFEGEPQDVSKIINRTSGLPKGTKSAVLKYLKEAKDADTKYVFTKQST